MGTTGTHTIYMFNAPQDPESVPAENILDYACEWAISDTTKVQACDDILFYGFDSHYTWNMNCHMLSSDFVRLVASLGVANAGLHRWASVGGVNGNMHYQRTNSIDPVGAIWGNQEIPWS